MDSSRLISTRLIALVRSRTEILGMVSEAVPAEGGALRLQVTAVPVHGLRRSLCPAKDSIQRSWNCLGAVRQANADALFHLLVVLMESVPGLADVIAPPVLPPEWSAGPTELRATQAHPRAFRGTKYQPPKNRRIPSTDLRPHLCDAASLRRVLSPLWNFLPSVRKRLEQGGYSAVALNAIEQELQPRARTGLRHWSFPPDFARFLWPLLRRQPWSVVSGYLSIFTTLDLANDEALLWAVCHLTSIAPETAPSWCRAIAVTPHNRRLAVIEKIIQTEAFKVEADAAAGDQLHRIAALAVDDSFAGWIEKFLTAKRDSLPIEYVLAGFRLAAALRPTYSFHRLGSCFDFPEQVVEEVAVELDQTWLAMALWDRCGQIPGLAEIIRNSAWKSLESQAAIRYFEFLQGFASYDLPEDAMRRKWAAIRPEVPRIEKLLLSTAPAYQRKAMGLLSECLSYWDDPAFITARLPAASELIRRWAAPPFHASDNAAYVLSWFLEVEDKDLLNRFLHAGDASFEALERACRRENDATLISRGLEILIRQLATFTIEAFVVSPKKLLKAARHLGGVAAPVRSQILARCREHWLFRIDVPAASLRDTCATIRDQCAGGLANPIPAGLAAWARGEMKLTDARLERYRHVLSEKLEVTRLDLIEQFVVKHLEGRLPARPATSAADHALRLLGSMDHNRRGLRKFLKAHWSGQDDYLAKHPATNAWYRKHAKVAREVWERGIDVQSEIAIQVERDPLEMLKLGTYVGSCLGIGGLCSYSAAAAVLDANKRVLYARDGRRNVIARQLVAISDDDRLVCFPVYPLSANKVVKSAFKEYDHAFAKALDLPLYLQNQADDDRYQIGSVLATQWWDDLNWDFEIPD